MQQIILKQHYGLGDYIICNALVRNFAKSYKVILPVAQQYIESVTFMYRDNSNIECVVHENFNYNTDIEIILNYKYFPENEKCMHCYCHNIIGN